MREISLGVAPYPQPSPKKNPGGDCFACALTAVVRHLFPEKPVPFDLVWESFKCPSVDGTLVLNNVWPTMRNAAYKLVGEGYRMEIRQDLVIPTFDVEMWSHCWWHSVPVEEWAHRLEAWLSAGWIALAEMEYAGKGVVNPDGTFNMSDHFVVLDGQRHYWKPHEKISGASSLEHDTHVVCSAKGAYWINTTELLRRHGTAGLTLLRKDER